MDSAALVLEWAGCRTQDRISLQNRVGLRCLLGRRGGEGHGDVATRRRTGGIYCAAVVDAASGCQRDAAAITRTGSRRDRAGLADRIARLNGHRATRRRAGGIYCAAVGDAVGSCQRDIATATLAGTGPDDAGLVDYPPSPRGEGGICGESDRAACRRAGCVDSAGLVDGGCGGKLHRAARGLAGGIQRTAVVDLIGPSQADHAAATGDRVGLHCTRVVDHRALQCACRHGGHQHLPVWGLDQLVVLDQGLDGPRVNLDVD